VFAEILPRGSDTPQNPKHFQAREIISGIDKPFLGIVVKKHETI
jgi:hypothetical protein